MTPLGPFAKEKDWHPHQQPLELFRYLVREYTDPGDWVIDTCGGGFTTVLGCYLENRHCIACDIDDEVVRRGTERLNKAMRGQADRPYESQDLLLEVSGMEEDGEALDAEMGEMMAGAISEEGTEDPTSSHAADSDKD